MRLIQTMLCVTLPLVTTMVIACDQSEPSRSSKTNADHRNGFQVLVGNSNDDASSPPQIFYSNRSGRIVKVVMGKGARSEVILDGDHSSGSTDDTMMKVDTGRITSVSVGDGASSAVRIGSVSTDSDDAACDGLGDSTTDSVAE